MKGNHSAKTNKTLGPESAELVLRLSGSGKNIFSFGEAQAIAEKSDEATATLLSKLVRRGWLVRLVPGKYVIVPLEAGLEPIPMADRYVIAREVLAPLPYYVSHYSAMELHQMTTHPVNTVHVTVPRRRTNRTIAGTNYRFIYARPRSFWGCESIWATNQEQVQVSDLEKTILDCAARPELCGGLSELAQGLWLRKEDLDQGRLIAHVRRLDHKAAAKRIGFLLETYGLASPDTVTALMSFVNAAYSLLDPTLLDEGHYRARWRLRINLDPRELQTSVGSVSPVSDIRGAERHGTGHGSVLEDTYLKTGSPDRLAFASEEDLVAELNLLGIRYLSRESAHQPQRIRPAGALLADLVRQPSARVRASVIAVLLSHPEYAGDLPAALSRLSPSEQLTLRLFYVAAMLLQQEHERRLRPFLAGRWRRLPEVPEALAGLGLPTEGTPRQKLVALGREHRRRCQANVNWTGTYEQAAGHLLRQWEGEDLWSP